MNQKIEAKLISAMFLLALCVLLSFSACVRAKHSPDGGTSTTREGNFRNVLFLRTPDAFCYRPTQSAKNQRGELFAP
jgi:hypothetical protein